MGILTLSEARDLLNEALNSPDNAINSPRSYIDHIGKVEAVAYQVAYDAFRNGVDVDPDFVQVCARVHDIGRTKPEAYNDPDGDEWDVHEYWTRRILDRYGFHEEAAIASRHFLAFEKADRLLAPIGVREEDGNIVIPNTYIQTDTESKVLTYADLSVSSDGRRVSWRIKIPDVVKKYIDRENEAIVRMLENDGVRRLSGICEEVETW